MSSVCPPPCQVIYGRCDHEHDSWQTDNWQRHHYHPTNKCHNTCNERSWNGSGWELGKSDRYKLTCFCFTFWSSNWRKRSIWKAFLQKIINRDKNMPSGFKLISICNYTPLRSIHPRNLIKNVGDFECWYFLRLSWFLRPSFGILSRFQGSL